MNCDLHVLRSPSHRLTAGFGAVVLALAMMLGGIGCSGDEAGATGVTSCDVDTDCPIGEVCSASGECVESPCEFCTEDQICYITEENPEGTCSTPECFIDDDCPDGEQCIQNHCGGPYNDVEQQEECTGPDDCPDGQTCSPGGNCIDDTNGGGGGGEECTTNEECPSGYECDDGDCVEEEGEECNKDASECPPEQPYVDTTACECVECLVGTDCGPDQDCENGVCVDEDPINGGECTPCDPTQPGICNDPTPYCVEDCCVECIGSGDCTGTEACVDGFCSDPGGCSSDAECPSGYSCENGQCEAPQSGQKCDPQDPDSCPDGQFCDPDTEECEPLGSSGAGCGLCNPDCTCDNNLTCDGFFCVGCTIFAGECSSDEVCMPLEFFGGENVCFPL